MFMLSNLNGDTNYVQGRQIESPTGLRIKENLKAQQLRRFISVGSGLDSRAIRDELKLKQAEPLANEAAEKQEPNAETNEDKD